MSDTPETDAAVISSNGQWSFVLKETCRRLERERNEARKELEEYRSIAENIGAKKAVSEKEQAIRERDELLNEIQRLRLNAQKEAEHHDRMVKELESLYDKLKS